ncbi:GNAT family N-acetyltransferase [Natronococcus wangiae]|uniref:GNAT family N-acetyltransferase n=1 Tax=Natronococcus wangiae TaxID=3068275 RepID=UPI00273E27E3|nr:GNAT family protein [Natronococcus sp. AD5]
MPGARVRRGERVTLRTLEDDDLPFLQRAYANPELRYPLGTPLKNREQLEAWLEDDDADRFLVCLDDADDPGVPAADETRPIGAVSVEDADWRRPELVYWLVPEVHGEGYGAEAVSLAIDYVFRTYDAPGVGAAAYDFNDASRALLESLGFAEEGRIRKDRFVDGLYRDTIRYGLLREEWRDGRGR